MGDRWISTIAYLFRPEHSLRLSCEKCTPVPVVRHAKKASPVSAKALFWTAVSIAAGLTLGQLR
jgi:hypothetical protein